VATKNRNTFVSQIQVRHFHVLHFLVLYFQRTHVINSRSALYFYAHLVRLRYKRYGQEILRLLRRQKIWANAHETCESL